MQKKMELNLLNNIFKPFESNKKIISNKLKLK